MEHLQHFGLRRDPFCNEPIPDQFLEIRPHREALLRLGRGVQQRKGLCVLTGEVGSGKTTAVRQLLETLEEELFEASMMVVLNASADANWIMTRFARQLGIDAPAREREALVAQVYEQLAIVREDSRHAVLIIDDAEAMAGGRALADVCGLLKLEYEDRRLLTLVLSGGPPLAAALAADPGLSARVEVRVGLPALDREAARDYLVRRIKAAAGVPAILQEDAMDAIHALGAGLPGRMNTLADNGLFEAFLASRTQLTRIDVERAHRDLAWSETERGGRGPAAGATAGAERQAAGRAEPAPPQASRALRSGGSDPAPGSRASRDGMGRDMDLELDSELDAAFAIGPSQAGGDLDDPLGGADFPVLGLAVEAPPKDDEGEVQDLLVELIED